MASISLKSKKLAIFFEEIVLLRNDGDERGTPRFMQAQVFPKD